MVRPTAPTIKRMTASTIDFQGTVRDKDISSRGVLAKRKVHMVCVCPSATAYEGVIFRITLWVGRHELACRVAIVVLHLQELVGTTGEAHFLCSLDEFLHARYGLV